MRYSESDLSKIAQYEEKRKIKYASVKGKLYERLFILGIISWAYMLFTSFSYIVGRVLTIAAGIDKRDNAFVSILVTASVCLLSILLYIFRLKIPFFAVNIAFAVANFISFAGICGVDDSVTSAGSTITEYDQGYFGLKKMFYWRHGIPVILLVIIFSVLIFIIVRERIIIKKEYELISKNTYESQILSDGE